MTKTQTIKLPDALQQKMDAEASIAEPIKREITDEEWEAQLPKPTGYRILIALPNVEEYYKGSTLLKTSDVMHKEYIMSIMGIVIDMGADAYGDKERFPQGPWCKEGDFILTRAYVGTRFKIHGREFRIINDDTVEGVVQDPRGYSRA